MYEKEVGMDTIKKILSGRKTYLVGGVVVINALIGWLDTDGATVKMLIDAAWPGFLIMTGRSAVNKARG